MELYVGTSGFSYKEWKGSFYPEKIPAKDMLGYYAERLPSVEINNTFYRMPRTDVLESWASQVPESFRFVIKASRRITHMRRLKEAHEETSYLLEATQSLGDRLGALLFQLPPNFKKDLERLTTFLELLPKGTAAAFEYRHPEWSDAEVYDALAKHNVPFALVDDDKDESRPSIQRTADWGYARLRREEYSDDDLTEIVREMREQQWSRAFVFFKHEDEGAGPALADRFRTSFQEQS